MELCNANNAKALVTQLYSNNTIYFNHKPIVKGTADLIKEYSYMNNKNYHLNLQPLIVKVVNARFAFEIGQCSGGYNGKYILIWKKHADGNWKIFIDSNI
jgi:ketosteroid isomerase-like protein